MGKRLIVNADGFGFTPGVNKGIVEAIKNGIVTSISCVVNFPYIKELPQILSEFPNISPGIHFNLSVGRPVTHPGKIPSLVNEKGEFWGDRLLSLILEGKINKEEIETELEAQVKILLDLGIHPTHWDGHQNKHLYPLFFNAAMKIAKKYNIRKMRTHRRYLFVSGNDKFRSLLLMKYYISHPKQIISHIYSRLLMRIARSKGFIMADRLITPGYLGEDRKFHLNTWLSILKKLPPGTNEIYCHPGYPDEILEKYAIYVKEREVEIKVLSSPEIKETISLYGIKLISFYDLES